MGPGIGVPFPASYHWVAPAITGELRDVVLELGLTGDAGLAREAATLAAWAGDGAVELIATEPDDEGTAALLGSAARPGNDLSAAPDEEALPLIAAVARRLHEAGAARPEVVPDSTDRLDLLRTGHPLVPAEVTDGAAELLDRLLSNAATPVLCHGDLHHANVVCDGDDWVAIDPHGAWGEPALDAGTALLNPLRGWAEVPDLADVFRRRVGLLAEGLGVSAERVRGWGQVTAAVSAVWTAQDHGRTDHDALAVAATLAV